MSFKLPSIYGSLKTSPITVPKDTSIFSTKTFPSLKATHQKEETPRKVTNPSLDRSKIARPKTASKSGRRPPSHSKGGRKTRKAKKSKKTRKNSKSKSKRKTKRNK
jgi:hypothetical protein